MSGFKLELAVSLGVAENSLHSLKLLTVPYPALAALLIMHKHTWGYLLVIWLLPDVISSIYMYLAAG